MPKLLALVLLLAAAVILIAWILGSASQKASSYGIVDPTSAVLRIENKTTDFAITRVFVGEAETGFVDEEMHNEIGPGKGAVVELEPGDYLVKISWVEIAQVEAFVPKGDLTERLDLAPGEAAILHMQGGRWHSDGLLCIPPKLAFK